MYAQGGVAARRFRPRVMTDARLQVPERSDEARVERLELRFLRTSAAMIWRSRRRVSRLLSPSSVDVIVSFLLSSVTTLCQTANYRVIRPSYIRNWAD